ncbi:MAG: acyloxyacyl hydrolase [Bacteroidetes bacterium]|nr:acyloxyacyl hydrolase [Bacteroidota bacterium]
MLIFKNYCSKSLRLSTKPFAFSAVKIIIILALSLNSFNAKSQETPKHFFTEVGFKIGISAYSIELPEGQNYKPLLLMGNFGCELTKKERKGKWWVMFEPQINPVFLDNKLKEVEFGINVAIRYKYKIGANSFFYSQLGSGPHFITVSTDRQAHGYIFSDNLTIGLSNKIFGTWNLDTEFRIRHISNANVMKPNRGMNNLFIVIGISKRINK